MFLSIALSSWWYNGARQHQQKDEGDIDNVDSEDGSNEGSSWQNLKGQLQEKDNLIENANDELERLQKENDDLTKRV